MGRDEVIAMVGHEPKDMRELKGFDVYYWESADGEYWALQLDYASAGDERVNDVRFRFVDRGCGARYVGVTDPDEAFRQSRGLVYRPRE